jgi:hypothetical protein
MVWLSGVGLLSLRLVLHYFFAERFKRRHSRLAPLTIQAQLQSLSYKLGINRAIDLLETSLTDSPAVIGMIKPIILITCQRDQWAYTPTAREHSGARTRAYPAARLFHQPAANHHRNAALLSPGGLVDFKTDSSRTGALL